MAIALSDEHQALSMSVRGWLASHCPPSVPRALLDVEVEELQPIWKEMAAEGWLGIHLPEKFGGQGFGLFELAVVLEETGRSMVPGPLLPTVATSALVFESAEPAAQARFLPGLIDGTSPATLSLGESALTVVERGTAGEITVSGTLRPLLGASTASLVLAPAREGERPAGLVSVGGSRIRPRAVGDLPVQPRSHPPGGRGHRGVGHRLRRAATQRSHH